MSNIVQIIPCKFADYYQGGVVYEHFGYRIYDDYDQDYANGWDTIESVWDALKPDYVLTLIYRDHSQFVERIRDAGLCIAAAEYDYDELSPPQSESDEEDWPEKDVNQEQFGGFLDQEE